MISERGFGILALVLACTGCAHGDPRRFPLATPVLRDHDLDPVTLDCDGEDDCAPTPFRSTILWAGLDGSIFRPVSHALRVRLPREADDVNAFDEVPDSSFFTNRMGTGRLSPEEVGAGACAEGPLPDTEGSPGSWRIDHGKDDGRSPGFRIAIGDTRFMIKLDEANGEQSTAAAAVATRLYHAAGFWTPCETVVHFRRELLRVSPGLTVQGNRGLPRALDEALLDELLTRAIRRGDRYRAVASRWLPGTPLGPFPYEGTKHDDPGDTVPHERRRPLRGSRVLAAWLGHYDAREQNTLATWLPQDEARPGRGHVRHWFIDMNDSFGERWFNDAFSRRMSHAYLLDLPQIGADWISFGAIPRAWDRVQVRQGLEDFGYFDAESFDPEAWRPEYPMLPFTDMTEADAAWMARILARFTRAHIEAAVNAGKYTNPLHAPFLVDTLLARRQKILARYFRKLSALTDVERHGDQICATDLARDVYDASAFHASAKVQRGYEDAEPHPVREPTRGKLCVELPSRMAGSSLPPDAAERYVVLRLYDGASRGPLELHFYDLGPRAGMQLVGIERPAR